MLHYILQIIAFQVVFLLVYDLFLKRETFFNYNRFYLLGTALLSVVLPFVKLESIKAVATKDFIIRLPEVIIGELSTQAPMIISDGFQNEQIVSQYSLPIVQLVFYGGVVLASFFFLSKIVKLYLLKSQNPKKRKGNILIVKLLKSSAAFSFFNTIFLGEYIPKTEKPTIIKHELVHVTQKHSIDLLFFEVLRIILWFNPLVYMYQNRIKTLHEYIADAQAIKNNGKRNYYQSLLNQVFETNNLSFINTFYKQSLIKKRIVMLQKSKSKQIALVKYALLIPLVFGMLFYTSCDKEVSLDYNENVDLTQFSYELSLRSGMDKETEKIHKLYEDFLKSNDEYVSWATINTKTQTISYSVHHKDDPVSDDHTKLIVDSADGKSYKLFMNIKSTSKDGLLDKTKNYLQINEEVIVESIEESIEVPFSVIEKVPVFPECKDLETNDERKECTSDAIAKFVNKNFNTDLAASLGLEGRQRISVAFKINKEGNIESVGARAPHPGLEDEAKRVIQLLPQFIPGTQRGRAVTVPYALPIVFQIQ